MRQRHGAKQFSSILHTPNVNSKIEGVDVYSLISQDDDGMNCLHDGLSVSSPFLYRAWCRGAHCSL